ncbi:hypothetical protein PPROV_000898100 [Pycnococcus provasolii]|uniref:Anaphase-promoting complex subunit 4 WD40 domain-containing protein n=1 Tax=Pycnococcus provasolii TaxID=41880 RepID=A0A830HZI7_9CHLO|nr:hypothetical protein PPROV_000898100 [Pycnococcus provasolii]
MHEIHAKHHEDVVSVSFSPDGTRMVSTGNNATICVWDATTGDVDGGHYGSVYSASYSPDGTRIVSASEDATVRVWDANSGACFRDKAVRVWDATSGACLSVLYGHLDEVRSASYSADGTRIISASQDNTVRVWDATTIGANGA